MIKKKEMAFRRDFGRNGLWQQVGGGGKADKPASVRRTSGSPRVARGLLAADMQPDADDTSLAFCQMMQAKDEQIRRLVLRMERCVSTRSHPPHP